MTIHVDPKQGLIDIARQVDSPNQDARPPDTEPELVVIHGISLPPGEFGGCEIENFFTNNLDSTRHPYFAEIANMHVSAHVLVRRDGEVVQYVPLNRRAWHAGESCYAGRSACNDFSIGIELEGTDVIPYTESQYQRLAELAAALLSVYPGLDVDSFVGHSDIAPGRKTDPGASFDWQKFHTKLNDLVLKT